jgi:muramoyltetrapeptide carboxypeptidase
MSFNLNPGDGIGLVAPAGPVDPDAINRGMEILTSRGFSLKTADHLFGKYRHFSGKIKDRIADIHSMLVDNSIQAIYAVRGGSGSSQLLPYLDFDLWKHSRKLFIGFSDITALQWALWYKTGLPSWSGMTLTSQLHEKNPFKNSFLDQISGLERSISAHDLHIENYTMVKSGQAEGILLGGNLSIIVSLLGTPYFPTINQDIIFYIEEINEPLYRIERAVVQLGQAGFFKNMKGLLLGRFKFKNRYLGIWSTIKPFIPHNIPIIMNFPYGHFDRSCALPLGVKATLSTNPLKIDW